MKHKKGRAPDRDQPKSPADSPKPEPANPPDLRDDDDLAPRWKPFPGPDVADEVVRVTLSRSAYADLIAHVKEELDSEVCGVLVGEFCEDDRGLYVSVEAAVRGKSARGGGAHVTYTQETWNEIYQVIDRDYPKRRIVGWYHSHPGFGVVLSENDLFIHRHFFAGRGQVAYVGDPLGGDEAVCVNTADGIAHLPRFWVDGRERKCRIVSTDSPDGSPPNPDLAELARKLDSVETRLSQLIQSVEDQRSASHGILMTLAMIVGLAIMLGFGYVVYRSYMAPLSPPKFASFDERVPVIVDGKPYYFGVRVVGWELPQELQAKYVEALLRQLEAIEKARKQKELEQDPAGTPSPAPSSSSPAPTSQENPR